MICADQEVGKGWRPRSPWWSRIHKMDCAVISQWLANSAFFSLLVASPAIYSRRDYGWLSWQWTPISNFHLPRWDHLFTISLVRSNPYAPLQRVSFAGTLLDHITMTEWALLVRKLKNVTGLYLIVAPFVKISFHDRSLENRLTDIQESRASKPHK